MYEKRKKICGKDNRERKWKRRRLKKNENPRLQED